MLTSWLYELDGWELFVGSAVAFLVCAIAGEAIGRRFQSQESDSALSIITATQGATLGLFAILIGFSFSTALNLYELRRTLVVDEANAIGTAELRSRILASPHSDDAGRQLRDYVQARLSFHRDSDDDAKLAEAIAASTKLQNELWKDASAASAAQPLSVPIGLYLQALNDMIDLHTKNLEALRQRVPSLALLLLYAIGLAGLGLIGYESGLSAIHRSFPTVIVAVLLAAVVFVVIDLDRPRRGLIHVGLRPLEDLDRALGPPVARESGAR